MDFSYCAATCEGASLSPSRGGRGCPIISIPCRCSFVRHAATAPPHRRPPPPPCSHFSSNRMPARIPLLCEAPPPAVHDHGGSFGSDVRVCQRDDLALLRDFEFQLTWLAAPSGEAALVPQEAKVTAAIQRTWHVVGVLLIRHRKQETVFFHPDKSSSRHLPHTGLRLCVHWRDRRADLEAIHTVSIYQRCDCASLCLGVNFVQICTECTQLDTVGTRVIDHQPQAFEKKRLLFFSAT